VEAKETVRALLERLPDDCTLDDVLYHLYVIQCIGRGLEDVDAGRVISHEEVEEELRRRWLAGVE
jgi:predicted transcriptional regulator